MSNKFTVVVMSQDSPVHLFSSRDAALIYSKRTGNEAQGIYDLLVEYASKTSLKVINELDRIGILINSGANIEDIDSIIKFYKFMKMTGKERDIHKVSAERLYLKRIERISGLIVRYYAEINRLGLSEVEDLPEFFSILNLKFRKDDYVSHIPPSVQRFSSLGRPVNKEWNGNDKHKIEKMIFPDYWSEDRWIGLDLMGYEGFVGIGVPDDNSIIQISNDLRLLGFENSIISQIPYFKKVHAPLNFLRQLLIAIDSNYDYSSMISFLENSILHLDGKSINAIKKNCYDNNVTSGWENWKIILQGHNDLVGIFENMAKVRENKDRTLVELERLFIEYFKSGRDEMLELLDILKFLPEENFENLGVLVSSIDAVSSLVKRSFPRNANIIIGYPEDLYGLSFDRLYLPRMDSTSSHNAFPDDAKDLIRAIEGKDMLTEYIEFIYSELLHSSPHVILSYSTLDGGLSYTESIPFYDSIGGTETRKKRNDVFLPISRFRASGERKKKVYTLSKEGVDKLMAGSISPTSFEVYLDCHFKYFVTTVMGVQEIDEPIDFLDARSAGSLTHKLLESFYPESKSPLDFIKNSDKYIESEMANQTYPSRRRALEFYRRKTILSGKLGRFILLDLRSQKEKGRTVIGKELRFRQGDGVFYEIDGKRVSLNGVIDRIDEEEGGLCIIDYKSSLNDYPKGKLCNDRKIQLFVYKLGVEKIMGRKVTSAAYVSFKDVSDGLQTAGLFYGIPNEAMEVGNCRKIIDPAIMSLLSGDFDPFIKQHNDIMKCERTFYCPLLSVCRGQERRW